MKTYSPEKIRNVLLFGHQGAGKTTLAESMLFLSGAINRMGNIADGTTTCDFEPEEIKKTLSVSLSLAPIEWNDHKINLLDSPGYADFLGEAQAAMRVADLAVLVVSAVDGVQVQHEVLWQMASKHQLPRLVFINKLDRERADFHHVLAQLSARLGPGFAPVDLPLGEEAEFHGIADVIDEKAYRYDSSGKPVGEEEADGALLEELHALHVKILESVAETDDTLIEKYLNGEELTEKEVSTGLHQGLLQGSVFPVLVGSATKLIGIDRLADLIVEMGPAPLEHPQIHGRTPSGDEVTRPPAVDQPTSAFVFKTVSDPYVGRISLFRVMTGSVRPDSTLLNASTGTDERIAQVFALRGKTQEVLPEVVTGDIGAIAKLAGTHSGNTLCDKSSPIIYDELEPVDRVLAKAIAPKTKGDEDKLMTGLSKLAEEDPTLLVERNPETHQTLLWGTGDAHLEVILDRLSRKFGVEVEELPLRIPYRETIRKPGKAIGRHVKQSGGHGQYAICNLEIEPLPRGAGFEFVDKIFGGSVPNQFIPSVQKGVEKTLAEGAVAGYPVVDIKVVLVDGKFHAVDSSDMAFQIAGSIGFREAVHDAGVTLLEPIMDLEVLVPDQFLGDIMGDLNSKRGRIQGTDAVGNRQLVKAKVPMSEVARYAIDLRSMTGGQGTFSSTFSHYEEVPAPIAETIVAEANAAKAEKSHK